ncbi:MAG: hypothetical protein ACYCX4_17250 [Bacillota bacterium]
MKINFNLKKVILVSIIGLAIFGGSYGLLAANSPSLPQNSPAGAEYKMPSNLPTASKGPYLAEPKSNEILLQVSKAHGETNPVTVGKVLTSHGQIRALTLWGESYNVADDREVYLVLMNGKFTFNRRAPGADPLIVNHIEMEIDATTGDVLTVTTSSNALPLYEPGQLSKLAIPTS